MPEKGQDLIDFVMGGAGLTVLFAYVKNTLNIHKRINKIKESCVPTKEYYRDQDKQEQAISDMRKAIEDGFRETRGDIKGVHERMDDFVNRRVKSRD
jgi:hypothetical protein